MKRDPVIIVGAGPAGLMAAIRAARLGADVLLLEKNPHPGEKLLLSGKGRCNLTNTAGLEDFLSRFSSNGAFLRDAFKAFFVRELMQFFESRGLSLKVERQQRVFPDSDRSASVLEVLLREMRECAVTFRPGTPVKGLVIRDGCIAGVELARQARVQSSAVVLATGGVSYEWTGSSGDGIRWAGQSGHRIVGLRPGLVALVTDEIAGGRLRGLTLKNIRLTFSAGNRRITTDVGELMFTDFGVSGPLVLTHSGTIADWLAAREPVSVGIDLKPGLSREQLDGRLLRECAQSPRKAFATLFRDMLPARLAEAILALAAVEPQKKANQISRAERLRLIALLKDLRLAVRATRPLREAMVTRGGVSVKDVDPRTMGSRVIQGLYFCGEMLDVDADTGGFNLQAAFSTGYLAGDSAARRWLASAGRQDKRSEK